MKITAQYKVQSVTEAFEAWLTLTRSFHSLTTSEIKTLAVILNKRHELKSKITDEELLDEYLFSTKVKKEIELLLEFDKPTRLPNIITSFRNKGVIQDNKINKVYIPNLEQNFKNFEISFNIVIDEK